MFQFLRQLWHRLCARLRFCGGVQYLAGTASLPSPLSPAEEKDLQSVLFLRTRRLLRLLGLLS